MAYRSFVEVHENLKSSLSDWSSIYTKKLQRTDLQFKNADEDIKLLKGLFLDSLCTFLRLVSGSLNQLKVRSSNGEMFYDLLLLRDYITPQLSDFPFINICGYLSMESSYRKDKESVKEMFYNIKSSTEYNFFDKVKDEMEKLFVSLS